MTMASVLAELSDALSRAGQQFFCVGWLFERRPCQPIYGRNLTLPAANDGGDKC
jgi:hypothetical protein